MLQAEDMVYVKNVGDFPVEFGWNSKYVTIEPGHTKPLQLEALINIAGDPRSTDHPQRVWLDEQHTEDLYIPSRSDEVKRLRHRMGIMWGDSRSFEALREITQDDPAHGRMKGQFEEYDPKLPQLEVTDDQGKRVFTVLEDPTGERAAGVTREGVSTMNLADEIDRLKRQLVLMEESMDRGQQAPLVEEEDLPAVEDHQPKVKSNRPIPESLKNIRSPIEPK
jgi:hypothetical protein